MTPRNNSDTVDPRANLRSAEAAVLQAVRALRKLAGEGNLTLRMPEAGDLVAILRVSDSEAVELESLLRR